MADDDELLAAELAWSPTFRTDASGRRVETESGPPGARVLTSLAALLWLILLGLSLAWLGPATADSAAGLGKVLGYLLLCALDAVLALWLARRLWVAMGATARAALRPFGKLSFFVFAFALLLGLGILAALPGILRQLSEGRSLREALAGGPVSGPDFVPLLDERGRFRQLDHAGAEAACATQGPGWRLPSEQDLDFLGKRLTHFNYRKVSFHCAARPGEVDPPFLSYDSHTKGFRVSIAYQRPHETGPVVCIRPAP